MAKSTPPLPAQIRNKKAHLRYQVLEQVECGLVLVGTEVKSLRQGKASLDEAFARITSGEIWLHGFHIAAYEHGNVRNHDPLRPRKLLLHRRQIAKLLPKVVQRGLTLIPLSVYFSPRGLAKVQLALAQGKSHRDKRQDLKKRDDKREMERALRRRR
ncbi:MAG: SsrA-binding protein SmpB [Planctomycetota bacterium]|jgi:SsrA-binding protein